ncbi:hypothetical protein BaRGS_00022088 [Batillaria attramentaria]|uniref:Uncharacterized protein n=1 Tax=Batillaria attramentaria TaxID=370345 RepID=A0ABD0KI34_9CAEN
MLQVPTLSEHAHAASCLFTGSKNGMPPAVNEAVPLLVCAVTIAGAWHTARSVQSASTIAMYMNTRLFPSSGFQRAQSHYTGITFCQRRLPPD